MRRSVLFLCLLLCSLGMRAQEMFSIAQSNYSPANGIHLNPAYSVDSKTFIDINVVGAHVFAMNDYAYLRDYSMLSNRFSNLDYALDTASGRRNHHAFVKTHIQLPTATISVGEYGFGFVTGFKTLADARNVPYQLANFMAHGFSVFTSQHATQFDHKNMRANSVSYFEIGVNAAKMIKKRRTDMMIVGGTVKYLIGVNANAARINEMNYTVLNGDDLQFHDLRADYMVSTPQFNAGRGFAVDLGFEYKKVADYLDGYQAHSPRASCKQTTYLYKFGVSLLDLGWLTINKDVQHGFFNDAVFNYDYGNAQIESPTDLNQEFQDQTEAQGDVKKPNRSWLPSALSVQFDYNFGKNFYGSAGYIGGIPKTRTMFGVERQQLLTVAGRYETKWVEAAIPVSLYQFRSPQVGLMLRMYNVVIGTDKLGTFLFKSDTYGADFYFNIKIPLFKNPKCGKGLRQGPSPSKKGSKSKNCSAYGYF